MNRPIRDPLRLFLLDADAEWMDDASCVREPRLPWIDSRPAPQAVAAMQEVCASCPVRSACEDYAIAADVTAGWWAGRSFSKYHIHFLPRQDHVAGRGDAA